MVKNVLKINLILWNYEKYSPRFLSNGWQYDAWGSMALLKLSRMLGCPNTILFSVLLLFRLRKFDSIHELMSFKQSARAWTDAVLLVCIDTVYTAKQWNTILWTQGQGEQDRTLWYAAAEECWLKWIEKLLSLKYDLNQFRAVPLIPTQDSKRDKRMLWSTVSNAAVKSRCTSTVASPESIVKSKSLKTFERAVYVLWRDLKPDWNFSEM